ncbi:transcriptional regulator [Bacillus thuringiensis]|uniref:helix-turn-helix domain-containing protein n=1 Tax=Bacillus thuringiensis TaxID=1428 RepID=UPI000BF7F0E4|nr:helix-turn-helix transcriptional regulator [Bacillus thuringiensis]PEV10281.1 transcriptional regulator [Bacillus thuringiensis]
MKNNKEALGQRIKLIRIKNGMTLEEFGKQILNANKSVVSKWEKGITVPNNERLAKIAEIGNVTIEYLLSGNPFDNLSLEEKQYFEKGQRQPAYGVIRKLSETLGIEFAELAWQAGLYTDADIQAHREEKAFWESMTPEEEEAYIERQHKDIAVDEYRRSEYPDVKEVLEQSDVYFNGKSLSKEHKELAIKMLDVLFEKLEVNYPSNKEIEKEYDGFKNMFAFSNQESPDSSKDK